MVPDYTQSPCYGQAATTRVYDVDTHQTPEVNATCRAEGERTRVYVVDELWEKPFDADTPPIDQAEINAFMYGFEVKGNAKSLAPEFGVLPTDELVFGELNPSLLTDGKLPIFIVDSGGAGEGYLCSWCDRQELHLDAPLLRSLHGEKAMSIAAHETFHAIHRGYDADETVWVDETLAEAAMSANGYFTDQAWLGNFLQNTNVAWGPSDDDPRTFNYGAGLLFGTYLLEHGGTELMRAITREPKDDWAGLDAALASVGDSAKSFELFQDMALAVFLDDDAGYGFETFDLANSVVPAIVGTGDDYSTAISPYGLVYVTFDSGARELTLESAQAVSARLVLAGNASEFIEVTPGEPVSFESAPRVLVLTAKTRAPITLSVR